MVSIVVVEEKLLFLVSYERPDPVVATNVPWFLVANNFAFKNYLLALRCF